MASLLTLDRISRAFSNVQALDAVSFAIDEGALHAIVGENGAGKSTLIHILSGALQPDSGALTLRGQPYRPRDPRAALQAGVNTLYQEPNLLPTRSVVANIALGQEPARGPWLRPGAARALARTALEKLSAAHLPLDAPVEQLKLSERQFVAMAHALVRRSRVLIMDEPTAALNGAEADALFDVLRRLRAEGVTIVYVSHRLSELFDLVDVVTVLRDGQHVRTSPIGSITLDDLIADMIGRRWAGSFPARNPTPGQVVLSVERLSAADAFENVSFELHAGEVLAVTGLTGSGMKELGQALFGAERITSGTVRLLGVATRLTPANAVARGLGYLPGDRAEGLLIDLPVQRNLMLPALPNHWGVIDRSGERQTAQQYAHRLQIKTPSLSEPVRHLSGGNQQKVALAKWLASGARVLILSDPTQGLDIGVRYEIYEKIAELTREGVAVLLVSADMSEVLGLAHRVLVMCAGRVAAELDGDPARSEEVLRYAVGTPPYARRGLT